MRALFVSDVHLSDPDRSRDKAFLSFLRSKISGIDRLYILGDFFDTWVGTRPAFLERYDKILKELKSWAKAGLPIFLLEGNHDFCFGDYFKHELGIQVFTDHIVDIWDGKKIYMCHGDMLDTDDSMTMALRTLLRSALVQRLSDFLPKKAVLAISDRTSMASRGYQKDRRDLNRIRLKYRKLATRLFHEGYDVVICGHTHIADAYEFEEGGNHRQFYNIGDWLTSFTHLEYANGRFSSHRDRPLDYAEATDRGTPRL